MSKTFEEDFHEIESANRWNEKYRSICLATSKYPYQYKTSQLEYNRDRNRYGDVNPFDHTRVHLQDPNNDYINSSYVTAADRKYILSQGPLATTAGHTWKMVWEQNSKCVVMLNKIFEKGQHKCFQYWPTSKARDLIFAPFRVSLRDEETCANYVIRKLELCKEGEIPRIILHFHYVSWPDFGVPESPDAFLRFMFRVQKSRALDDVTKPAVIHCSAGIGRSGTFALVEACSRHLRNKRDFDVIKELLELRRCRMGLIQTPHQLRFSYLAIVRYSQLLRDQDDDVISSDEETPFPSSDVNNPIVDDDDDVTDDDDDEDSSDDVIGQAERKRVQSHLDENREIEAKKRRVDDVIRSERVLRHRQMKKKSSLLKKRVEEMKEKMKKDDEKKKSMTSSWKWYVISSGGLLLASGAVIVAIVTATRWWW